jgi:signal transduction histidine kinase
MARMLGDFLDFAHTQLGKRMPIKRSAAHLGRLCSDVVTETRAAHPDQQIHYSATGDVTGDWDAPRLRQVISNLLGNAVQHGTAGTPIELTLRNEGDDVAFSLTNEGAAIPAELVPRIFHPMIRGVSPESRAAQRPGSMGLGLYIAREVVTSHGGTIDVVSSASGITTFTVRLPRRPVSQE